MTWMYEAVVCKVSCLLYLFADSSHGETRAEVPACFASSPISEAVRA